MVNLSWSTYPRLLSNRDGAVQKVRNCKILNIFYLCATLRLLREPLCNSSLRLYHKVAQRIPQSTQKLFGQSHFFSRQKNDRLPVFEKT